MALQFNSLIKGSSGIPAAMLNQVFSTSMTNLYIYPSTVAFPSTCPTALTSPYNGYILSYTNINTTPNFWGVSGSTLSMAGSKIATTTAAGTLSWFWLTTSGGSNTLGLCSDSISAPGGGGICIVSTLTPTNGQSVTLSALSITLS